jgi:hypothetical protein
MKRGQRSISWIPVVSEYEPNDFAGPEQIPWLVRSASGCDDQSFDYVQS